LLEHDDAFFEGLGLWEDGVMVKFGSLFVVIEMHEEGA
jgi:hypothetical protein